MAETGRLTAPSSVTNRARDWVRERPVTAVRIFIVVTVLLCWEALAQSGLLYRDVVPSLIRIVRALYQTLIDPTFYFHLYTTFYQIAVAMVIGGVSGLAVGIALGGSKLMQRAYEPLLY